MYVDFPVTKYVHIKRNSKFFSFRIQFKNEIENPFQTKKEHRLKNVVFLQFEIK